MFRPIIANSTKNSVSVMARCCSQLQHAIPLNKLHFIAELHYINHKCNINTTRF